MTNDFSVIQTLYIPNKKNSLSNTLGYLSPEFNWMSWTLSCLQLNEIYGNVELYTNKAGKEVLIDLLELPYSKVNIVLDDINFPSSLWAYPKLYTYSLQKKPFIHVDGDVFIWDKLKIAGNQAKLIVQNRENTDYYYRPIIEDLIHRNFCFPHSIQYQIENSVKFSSINAGIIGGSDIDFFCEYTSVAFEFVNSNIDKIALIDPNWLNMVFEQFFFSCLADQRKIKIDCQIADTATDMDYLELLNFSEVPHRTKYIHMVGSYKKSPEASILLAKRLRRNYPNYYYNIIRQCKHAGIIPFFNCYKDNMNEKTIPEGYANLNTEIDWMNLYKKEKSQQIAIDLTFKNVETLRPARFQINKLVIDVNLLTIKVNKINYLKIPCGYFQLLKKIEVEPFDMALIEILRQPTTFEDLCHNLKALFDKEEINSNEANFIELIRLKLLNGCNSNLFIRLN